MRPAQTSELYEALGVSQRLGFLGSRPIPDVVDHARRFVPALDAMSTTNGRPPRVIDLGSGGGIPGLVLGLDCPDFQLTLIDRRTKRTDFLQRVVLRLGWSDRVTVVADDVAAYAKRHPGEFDGVVARGLGPPEKTLGFASQLSRVGGIAAISEPPKGDRWPRVLVAELGFVHLTTTDRIASFERTAGR